MGWFKRLCMFLFGLSGILSLAALSLVWVGPWTAEARTLILEYRWYFIALEVLVCISGVGLLGCVLAALFAPRSPKETIVAEVDGSAITVTRAAIVSQVRHVLEADGTCTATSVHARMRKRGHVKVNVKVTPHRPVDVIACGSTLHEELAQGLSKICGDCVQSIDIVFTEPEQRGSLATYVDDAGGTVSATSGEGTRGADITIPMTTSAESLPEAPMEMPQEPVVDEAGDESGELAYDTLELHREVVVAEEPVQDDRVAAEEA